VNSFVQQHRSDVIGVLSGFDRLVFRGTVRPVAYAEGMRRFLSAKGVLLKDFGAFAEAASSRVKQASLEVAERVGCPVQYLGSAAGRKDELAQAIAKRDGVGEGLVCVFKTVEPLLGFDIFRNREQKQLELVMRQRKCLYLYHYYLHPVFGFMHIRLQTWLPFQVQIWINGREWLCRTLDRKKVGYERRDNCLPWIQNVERAQRLMDEQLRLDWPIALDLLRLRAHPAHEEIFAPWNLEYYWSAYQSEWATDVMFRSPGALAPLYQRLVHQGITRFGCADVLRFLGKKVGPHAFAGEASSDLRERFEGIRLKHRADGNSVKLYDKQGSVLRAETTINEPDRFKVYRTAEGQARGRPEWRAMRKGVADLARRAQVSQQINDRYLDALASLEDTTPLGELTAALCRPTRWKGRHVRALHPWSPDDLELLRTVARGDFLQNGLRNADLRAALYGDDPPNASERRRRSAATTRRIRLLRAHGLLAKRPRSHRYILTEKGQRVTSALLAAYHANADSLSKLAA
jgi:hypothetical protein